MKIAVVSVVVLHAAIHLLGFIKGFGYKEIKELTLPISKTTGMLWLSAALLLMLYGVAYALNSKYSWVLGGMALLISQFLIFAFWKDAKFGTLPNMLILMLSILSWANQNFQKKIQTETLHILSQNSIPVTREHWGQTHRYQTLPETVKHWLRSSGALDKPFTHCGKILQKAEMQMKPEQTNWLNATAVQYTTIDNPAFIWSVDVRMNRLLSFQGRDKFENGKGEMLIKLNSLINVVNARGAKIDEGSLQRFLGEMVWFPSMALSPYIQWEELSDSSAKATMTLNGTSGSGIFTFNPQGQVSQFSALRFKGNEPDAQRHEWQMNISDYATFEGITVPAKMTSTWKLDSGDWTWLKLEVTDIRYNENALNETKITMNNWNSSL